MSTRTACASVGLLVAGALPSGCAAGGVLGSSSADILIRNAKIYTVDDARRWAQTAAIKAGDLVQGQLE